MKKVYFKPATYTIVADSSQFICASTLEPEQGGPTSNFGDPEGKFPNEQQTNPNDPIDDSDADIDAQAKHSMIWDEW